MAKRQAKIDDETRLRQARADLHKRGPAWRFTMPDVRLLVDQLQRIAKMVKARVQPDTQSIEYARHLVRTVCVEPFIVTGKSDDGAVMVSVAIGPVGGGLGRRWPDTVPQIGRDLHSLGRAISKTLDADRINVVALQRQIDLIPRAADDMMPASHYQSERAIPPTRLEAARRDGRISVARGECRQFGKLWRYSMKRVRELWPEDFS